MNRSVFSLAVLAAAACTAGGSTATCPAVPAARTTAAPSAVDAGTSDDASDAALADAEVDADDGAAAAYARELFLAEIAATPLKSLPTPASARLGSVGFERSIRLSDSGLDASQIRRVVLAHSGALGACYELALQKNPSLAGSVIVRFAATRGYDRKVAEPLSSTLPAQVTTCIVRHVSSMVFPPLRDGAALLVFEYGFTFRPPPERVRR